MSKMILFIMVFCFSIGYAQIIESPKIVYGIKLLSFENKANEKFIGLSLPLISGTGVSDNFIGIDIGIFLSGCSKIIYYPKHRIDTRGLRVYKYKGIALSGLINSMMVMDGVSLTPGLISADYFNGMSLSGLTVIDNFKGFSTSWLIFISDNASGFSFGGLISGGDKFKGVSSSLLISGANYFEGLSIGSISLVEKEMTGVQIGLINYTKQLKGIQIGIINIAKNAILPYTIGINWCF